MKKYKVIAPNGIVIELDKNGHIHKEGDVIELPPDHVRTRALLERKRIVEFHETKAPAPPAENNVKPSKK